MRRLGLLTSLGPIGLAAAALTGLGMASGGVLAHPPHSHTTAPKKQRLYPGPDHNSTGRVVLAALALAANPDGPLGRHLAEGPSHFVKASQCSEDHNQLQHCLDENQPIRIPCLPPAQGGSYEPFILAATLHIPGGSTGHSLHLGPHRSSMGTFGQ